MAKDPSFSIITMTQPIYKLDIKDKATLASIRCVPGLCVAQDDKNIWLRGIDITKDADCLAASLPVKQSFWLDEKKQLFLTGTLVPVALLAEMQWQDLADFIPLEIPVSAMPGKITHILPVHLIPSTTVKESQALVTELSVWKNFAEYASVTRLRLLDFAVSENRSVLIMGIPLPPIPGAEYWKTGNMLLPAGYDFEIPNLDMYISRRIDPQEKHIIVFNTDGSWQLIEKSFFIRSTRSAVRLTMQQDD